MSQRKRRTYDHRIKAQIIAAGDPSLFPELQIPRSTAMSWIRLGAVDIVTIDDVSHAEQQLRTRLAKLDCRVSMLISVLRLVLALLRTLGFKAEQTRLAEAEAKRRLPSAIDLDPKIQNAPRTSFSPRTGPHSLPVVSGNSWRPIVARFLTERQA